MYHLRICLLTFSHLLLRHYVVYIKRLKNAALIDRINVTVPLIFKSINVAAIYQLTTAAINSPLIHIGRSEKSRCHSAAPERMHARVRLRGDCASYREFFIAARTA